jgi:hypothetical protein
LKAAAIFLGLAILAIGGIAAFRYFSVRLEKMQILHLSLTFSK